MMVAHTIYVQKKIDDKICRLSKFSFLHRHQSRNTSNSIVIRQSNQLAVAMVLFRYIVGVVALHPSLN